uniref:Ribosome-binding protein 1 n=1 Tax=Acrobeloides nanus TaxID=290746 RepID=A0A914DP95_9BILA
MVREFLASIDHYFEVYPIPSIIAAFVGFVIIMFLSYKVALRFVNTDTVPDKFTPILTDEKSKKKKPKPIKQKKTKSENHVNGKEKDELEVDKVEIVAEEPVQLVSESVENALKPNGPQKEKSRKKRSSKEPEIPAPVELPIVEEAKVEEKADVEVAPSTETGSKKKKKNRRKGSSEVVYEEKITETLKTKGISNIDENLQETQQVVVEEEVQIVITHQETQNAPEAKKKAKVPVNDLTVEKVLSRLTSVEDLEPEYLNFLKKYEEQSHLKEAKLSDNVNHLKKQTQDKDRTINELNLKVTLLEGKLNEELPAIQKQLVEERRQHEVYENTVRQKLAENGKLTTENKQLRTTLDQVQRAQTQSQSSLREIEELKVQLNNMRNSATQEISKKEQQISQINTEVVNYKNQFGQLNHLKGTLEEQNRQLNRELEALRQSEKKLLEERQRIEADFKHIQSDFARLETALQSERNNVIRLQQEQLQKSSTVDEQLTIELNRVKEEVHTWKLKYQETERSLETSKTTLNNLHNEIDALKHRNQELNEHSSNLNGFESKLQEQQNENDRLRKELHVATLKIEDFSRHYSEHSGDTANFKKLQHQYEEILNQLHIAQAKLDEFDGIYQAQQSEINDSQERIRKLNQENDQLKEELQNSKSHHALQNHIEHEKENISNVTKISHVSDDRLNAELEEQKRKNDELRQRNYKIVEDVRKIEQATQKMISDLEAKYSKNQTELVHVITSELEKLAPKGSKLPNLKKNTDSEELIKWIHGLAHVLSAHPAQLPQQTHKKQQEESNQPVEQLQNRLKSYEKALANVNQHLHEIERAYAANDKSYKQKIATLENQLNNRS